MVIGVGCNAVLDDRRRVSQWMTVFGDLVGLEVEVGADLAIAEGGAVEGFGDESDVEGVVADGGEGEADAVKSDRALGCEVVHQVGGRAEGDTPLAVGSVEGDDLGEAVDVALDEVAAEGLAGEERGFKVDRVAGLEAAEGGEAEGLGDDVEYEPVVARIDSGEADARDADGVALPHLRVEAVVIDDKALAGIGKIHGDGAAAGLDDAGEHGGSVGLD